MFEKASAVSELTPLMNNGGARISVSSEYSAEGLIIDATFE